MSVERAVDLRRLQMPLVLARLNPLNEPVTKTVYILQELRFKLWLKPAIMGIAAVGWVTFAYAGASLWPLGL